MRLEVQVSAYDDISKPVSLTLGTGHDAHYCTLFYCLTEIYYFFSSTFSTQSAGSRFIKKDRAVSSCVLSAYAYAYASVIQKEMPWVLRIHEIGCLSIKLFLVLFIPRGISKKLKFDFGLFSAIKKGFKVNIV